MSRRASVTAGHTVHLLDPVELRQPFWRYFELLRERPYAFLLDSAREAAGHGRWSFMGADPVAVLAAKRVGPDAPRLARIAISWPGGGPDGRPRADRELIGDPLAELRRLLAEHAPTLARSPMPLLGGAVGYVGYEAGHFVERLPDRGRDDLGQPDLLFALHDLVLGHDAASGETYLSTIGRGAGEREAGAAARRRRDAWLALLDHASPAARPRPAADAPRPLEVSAHFDRPGYAAAVETCKRHIERGDAFEICLTHRREAAFEGDPLELYERLREVSPSPYAAYLALPSAQVICSSPECFLRMDADGRVESRPIKGTRPRGETPALDQALASELAQSPKDRAENLMIVDLVRNDLGRVCRIGSVHVPDLTRVEQHPTLFQLTSTIAGRLEPGRDALDLVRAAFPGGSMTGAPKIAAMKIIDALEPVKRGIYSGSIGYLDYGGALSLNIVIRTIVVRGGRAYWNVGGAIVADSDPFDEYDETLDKAYALERALRLTQPAPLAGAVR